MSNNSPLEIKDIGEQGLLTIVKQFCPANVVGDDGAIFRGDPGKSLVVTTDVLVEGVHFSDRTTSPTDAGWRAAAANLSDLAAMGATPIGITVGLALRSSTLISWVEQLYQGITECLQRYDTAILGGDLCRSKVVTIAITAIGQVVPEQAILRSAAQPGDLIVVTGSHGSSRAGLELLLNQQPQTIGTRKLIKAHQRPMPRLDVLSHLHNLNLSHPIGGMDSSDGLADAVIQICRSSGVGALIEAEAIPKDEELHTYFPQQALEWSLYGGEDFELVLCLPKHEAWELVQSLGNQAAIIGNIIQDQTVSLSAQKQPLKNLSLASGFQHFNSY